MAVYQDVDSFFENIVVVVRCVNECFVQYIVHYAGKCPGFVCVETYGGHARRVSHTIKDLRNTITDVGLLDRVTRGLLILEISRV